MHEMQIDIEERASVRILMDDVLLPKLFEKCLSQHLHHSYRVVSLPSDDRCRKRLFDEASHLRGRNLLFARRAMNVRGSVSLREHTASGSFHLVGFAIDIRGI